MWKKQAKATDKTMGAIIASDVDASIKVKYIKTKNFWEDEQEPLLGFGNEAGARWSNVLLMTKNLSFEDNKVKSVVHEDEVNDSGLCVDANNLEKGSISISVDTSATTSTLIPESGSCSSSSSPEAVQKIQKSDSVDSGDSGHQSGLSGASSDEQSESTSEAEIPTAAKKEKLQSQLQDWQNTGKIVKKVKFHERVDAGVRIANCVTPLTRTRRSVCVALVFAAQRQRQEEATEILPMKRLFDHTQFVSVEPFSIRTERINQRHFEATFSFRLPAACLTGIKQANFKFILNAGANFKFQTAYLLTTCYQLVFDGDSHLEPADNSEEQEIEMEHEPGFLNATCFSYNCRPDSSTSLFFSLTSQLVNIVDKLKEGPVQLQHKKEKVRGFSKSHCKFDEKTKTKQRRAVVDFLRLDLTLRRRFNLSPTTTTMVEQCDLAHFFQPALLFIEWDQAYVNRRTFI